MGNKLKNDIAEYFAGGRNDDTQINVMEHKPTQIVNTTRISFETIYITTYNGADLLRHFSEIYTCKYDFHGLIN